MWREIGMIGRDKFLTDEVHPRILSSKPPFILVGSRGIGKTAILEWAYDNASGTKALISCSMTMRECLVAIAKQWGLRVYRTKKEEEEEIDVSRAKVDELEKVINGTTEGSLIFIDDIHEAKPDFINHLRAWRERFIIFVAGTPPFKREKLVNALHGLSEFEITALNKDNRQTLAVKVCEHLSSDKVPSDIANNCQGFPARIVALVKGDTSARGLQRSADEEFDISPIFVIGLILLVAMRYIGRGLDDTAMIIVGGLATIALILFRPMFSAGKKKQ